MAYIKLKRTTFGIFICLIYIIPKYHFLLKVIDTNMKV